MGAPQAPAQDLAALFQFQADACERLGSPFTHLLLTTCGARIADAAPGHPIFDRLRHWPGDAKATGDAIALRFAGALHALVLTEADPGLAAVYPPATPNPDALWGHIERCCTDHQAHILHWLDSAPQTNEVRRCAAMIATAHLLARDFPGLPLRINELGASAGLNLFWDRYALALTSGQFGAADPVITLRPEWQGAPPPANPYHIIDRRGVDLNPLDPLNAPDALRLRSYTWPDQADRMERLDAALTIAKPLVDRGDAGDWLGQRLRAPAPNQINFVFNTIAWQYFPPETDQACRAALARAGARATPTAPLAHLNVELDGTGQGAKLTLTLWSGQDPVIRDLGYMDPHGRSLIWTG